MFYFSIEPLEGPVKLGAFFIMNVDAIQSLEKRVNNYCGRKPISIKVTGVISAHCDSVMAI